MSSAESRSSSAVRNLRSIFENKASEGINSLTPDSRGRSPNGVGSDKENGGRPKSKVRANFVAVEPVLGVPEADRDFGLKKTVSEKHGRAAAGAMGTPANLWGALQDEIKGDVLGSKVEQQPANPDKPVTGKEEEPGDMKPAELSSEKAVSGGEALPPAAEDLRPSEPPASANSSKKLNPKAKSTTSTRPAAIATKPSSKPSTTSVKSPVSQPKTPLSAKASASTVSPLAKKASRSSLTAPTAASMARAGASDKPPSNKTSPTAKSQPRALTKPLNIPSHLTAPTASSKAKHEPDVPAVPAVKTTLTHRPKPQTSSAKPRASLAAAPRPTSRDSSHSARKSLLPVDGSFLDRMTRPTAASASKTTEKVEARSPPSKAKTTTKPKVNGVPKTASKPSAQVAEPSLETSDALGLSFTRESNTIEAAIAAVDAQMTTTGTETPIHTNGEANPALEATPAGLAIDDTIR